MKRPSFQFYPADWRNNAKLRRCSWEARGAWLEVMCLLHDSEEYGLLRWPLKEVAQAIGAPIKLLNELVAKGVIKGGDKGHDALIYTPRSGRKDGAPVTLISPGEESMWFSSRMVIDEHVRQKKANHELYKDSPHYSPKPPIGESPNKTPKPPESDLPTSTSTSTSTSKDLKHSSELSPGKICIFLKNEGFASVNPAHPKLTKLLEDGATAQNFQSAAITAKERGKGFAYVLGVVEGQMAESKNPITAKGRAQKFDAVAYVNQGRSQAERNVQEGANDVIDAE